MLKLLHLVLNVEYLRRVWNTHLFSFLHSLVQEVEHVPQCAPVLKDSAAQCVCVCLCPSIRPRLLTTMICCRFGPDDQLSLTVDLRPYGTAHPHPGQSCDLLRSFITHGRVSEVIQDVLPGWVKVLYPPRSAKPSVPA